MGLSISGQPISPKIGSDFSNQYGIDMMNEVAASTMTNVSDQNNLYNFNKVQTNQNTQNLPRGGDPFAGADCMRNYNLAAIGMPN